MNEAEQAADESQNINPIDEISQLLAGEQAEETPDESQEAEAVNELLSDSESDNADESEIDDSELEETDEAFNLSHLAEKLDVDKADLYSVEIPLGDDKIATLGELKDAYKDAEELTQERENLELERVKGRNEYMTARDQLTKVMQYMGDVPQEALEYAESVHRAELETAGKNILAAIPEWSDPNAIKSDMSAMANHLKSYGFSESDLNMVTDHRLMSYVRDNMRREAQANQAKERIAKQRKAAPKNLRPSKQTAKNAAQARLHKAAKAGDRQAQTALVTDLIT